MPVRVAVIGEFEALLLNVAEAEAAPLAPGVNVTVKLIGWLVVTVSGNESPLMENSERLVPVRPTEETDTLAPVAVRVPV